MQRISSHASFGGRTEVWEHASSTLGVTMKVGVYLPPQANHQPCPVLWYLSGLTCSEQNVLTKGGFQAHCARQGIVLICPDTSPRGPLVADDPAWDLGQAASFYVDATEAPWAEHFQMHRYLTEELPGVLSRHLPITQRHAITGHSMGGHGALVLGLRHPSRYCSVSAFAPIVAPSQVPWGQKAFRAYLGDSPADWAPWDATELVKTAPRPGSILIDQGAADSFLTRELQPERFEAACAASGQALTLRLQPGYDHSYYFISTFAGDHVDHAAAALFR